MLDISAPFAFVQGVSLLTGFFIGCCCLHWTMIFGDYALHRFPSNRQALINLSKKHFVSLIIFMSAWMNPSTVSVSWDSLPEGTSFKNPNGDLVSSFSPNSVFIANHQVYTDWLFLWFLTYSARISDTVHIILKDMSNIPILGRGMRTFNFLFLSRKWENDKIALTNKLLLLDANARGMGPANGVKHVASVNSTHSLLNEGGKAVNIDEWPQGENPNQIWPYTIILYPEGTVPSIRTRANSVKYIEAKGYLPLKHVLLPRVRGLFLTLRKLRNTVEVVYDFTAGYSGVKPTEFGEDVFTLKRTYLLGKGPRSVHFYVRSWKLSEIPLGVETLDVDDALPEDLAAFENWLNKVWREKDEMMETFYTTGKFVGEHTVSGPMRLRSAWEIVPAYIPLFLLIIFIRLAWLGIRSLLR